MFGGVREGASSRRIEHRGEGSEVGSRCPFLPSQRQSPVTYSWFVGRSEGISTGGERTGKFPLLGAPGLKGLIEETVKDKRLRFPAEWTTIEPHPPLASVMLVLCGRTLLVTHAVSTVDRQVRSLHSVRGQCTLTQGCSRVTTLATLHVGACNTSCA